MMRKNPLPMRLVVAILTFSLLAPTVNLSAQTAARPPLRNDDVIQMATANLSESLILSQIADSQTNFDLSTSELIRLSTAFVSDAIIAAMRRSSASVNTRSLEPVDAPVVAPPAAAVKPLTQGATEAISPGSSAEGERDGEQLAETVGTGGKVFAGVATGLFTSLIGTSIGYFVIGPQELSAPAALAREGKSPEYQQGFATGWARKSQSKKRNAFLIGGLLGTAAWVAAVIQFRSAQEECGYIGTTYVCY